MAAPRPAARSSVPACGRPQGERLITPASTPYSGQYLHYRPQCTNRLTESPRPQTEQKRKKKNKPGPLCLFIHRSLGACSITNQEPPREEAENWVERPLQHHFQRGTKLQFDVVGPKRGGQLAHGRPKHKISRDLKARGAELEPWPCRNQVPPAPPSRAELVQASELLGDLTRAPKSLSMGSRLDAWGKLLKIQIKNLRASSGLGVTEHVCHCGNRGLHMLLGPSVARSGGCRCAVEATEQHVPYSQNNLKNSDSSPAA